MVRSLILTLSSIPLIFLMASFPEQSIAKQENVKGTGCYKYGDSESPQAAKTVALDIAKRNAIESYKVFVASKTKVKDFELKSDIITAISAGYLYKLNIVKEDEKNRDICVSIEAKIDPAEVNKMIENKILTSKLGLDASDETEKIEEGIIDWNRKVVRTRGFGGANKSFPSHVWKKSAEDAARGDAQTKLIELVDGLKLQSKTFIQNYQVASDEKIIEIKGKIRNVRQIGKTIYPTKDTAEVVLELNLGDVLK
jgi:hypothetical protein